MTFDIPAPSASANLNAKEYAIFDLDDPDIAAQIERAAAHPTPNGSSDIEALGSQAISADRRKQPTWCVAAWHPSALPSSKAWTNLASVTGRDTHGARPSYAFLAGKSTREYLYKVYMMHEKDCANIMILLLGDQL